MDYHLKQWGNQHQSSEHLCSSKFPKLLFEQPHHQQQPSESALPLFISEPNNRMTNLSAFSDSTASRYPRVKGLFSLAQWQELEVQALIFKYMLVGAVVPAQLIDSIKKSLPDNNPACYLHHPLQQYKHFQPAMLRSGYWGRTSIDPEPGRCRRTDGKKWRCSKDVVAGQKYCERHMHRGRNRSRKPVENSTQATGSDGLRTITPITASASTTEASGIHFALSMPPPSPLNRRTSENKPENEGLLGNLWDKSSSEDRTDGGRILRQFFDDWPRSQQESDHVNSNANQTNLPTCLSISIPGDHHPSSDFSLKLSTGNGDDEPSSREENIGREEHNRLNWGAGWGGHQMNSMGGPLAEALRLSAPSSSPTSVLRVELPRRSGSDISSLST